jgi:hypothetical protein
LAVTNRPAIASHELIFSIKLIFQFCSAKNAERVLVERPVRSLKAKTPPSSAKRGMKAFDGFRQKSSGGPASSFSLRRSAPKRGADERYQTGILTWASNLIPPSR